ncbi:hypothetical protein [Mesonia aquimarina]|uniref:hypothetical protein n=1 Tax=Mesonia aquimarina TaxID=1504967 RepID=UPI000EF5ABC0|nr:hypothetical protein [Mesonia aquimarina]
MFNIVFIGILATSAMTLFSFLYEEINSGKFKEPHLLNSLIRHSSSIPLSPFKNNWLGWFVHYFIGLVFVITFELVVFYDILEFSVWNSLLYGIVIGVIGIIGWNTMFVLNTKPSNLKPKHYYKHLIGAHAVFGITMGLGYMLLG